MKNEYNKLENCIEKWTKEKQLKFEEDEKYDEKLKNFQILGKKIEIIQEKYNYKKPIEICRRGIFNYLYKYKCPCCSKYLNIEEMECYRSILYDDSATIYNCKRCGYKYYIEEKIRHISPIR